MLFPKVRSTVTPTSHLGLGEFQLVTFLLISKSADSGSLVRSFDLGGSTAIAQQMPSSWT